MRAYISDIKFNSGVELSLNKDDIVVFVGPNNVGKSQALQDIYSLCERAPKSDPYFPIIVDDIEIHYEDIESVIEDSLKYGWAKERPGGIVFRGEYYSEKKVRKHHSDKGFGVFKDVYLYRKRQIMERIASFHALPYNCRKIDIGSFYYNQEDRKCRLLANNVFLCQSRSDSSPNAAGAA